MITLTDVALQAELVNTDDLGALRLRIQVSRRLECGTFGVKLCFVAIPGAHVEVQVSWANGAETARYGRALHHSWWNQRWNCANLLIRMIHLTIFLIFVHLLSAAGKQSDVIADSEYDDKSRLWNASKTSYEEHPYFAAIMIKRSDPIRFAQFCGGAFITPRIVITAAHCLETDQRLLKVRYGTNAIDKWSLGESNKIGTGIDHEVAETFIHPDYRLRDKPTDGINDDRKADVGLVLLRKPIEHSSFVLQLPRPFEDARFIQSEQESILVAMGYSFGDDKGSVMKQTSVNLFRDRSCLRGLDWRKPHQAEFVVCGLGDEHFYRICAGKISPIQRVVKQIRPCRRLWITNLWRNSTRKDHPSRDLK